MRKKKAKTTRVLSVVLSLLMILSVISIPKITVSAEGGVDGFVERCYTVTLDRGSEPDGFADWKDQLVNGKSVGVNIAYGFLFSKEYTNKNKSNEDYVKDLYKLFMDREPDEAGFNDWVGKLKEGKSRQEVFAGFANSQEFYNICESYGITAGYFAVGYDRKQVNNVNLFVDRLYQICLGRRGDRGGQKDWVIKLLNKQITGIECARCFIQSKEYVNKNLSDEDYVENLYKAMMGRASDEGGKVNWLYGLKNGMTRDEVFAGFANSKEFGDICARYGIDKGSYTAKDKGSFNKDNPGNQDVHIHKYDKQNTDKKYLKSAATCTKKAEYYYSCECGEYDKNNTFTYGDALGHSWDEGKITKEPSLCEDGVKTYKCTRSGCGETKEEAIPCLATKTNVGDVIKFGKYEQDGNTSNGKEDIEWQVIAKEDGRLFVLSKYILDCQPYNTVDGNITWENCSLRRWLNNDFLNTAFSDAEKKNIPTVLVENKDNHLTKMPGGNNTYDKVFCLSMEDAETYFGEPTSCINYKGIGDYNDNMAMFYQNLLCTPTQYAIDRGAANYFYEPGKVWQWYDDDIGGLFGIWWLRTPGSHEDTAEDVTNQGVVWFSDVEKTGVGVRPAMYLEY